ncbi:MarR family winged helix-turn-helix transcriptional regulator [Falsiroseomonas tokyonensis]|uniref:MarR family winged helix-turn-helix transcriptional regulator n=1 Tax=Falsiroseomonas tokyonensis TaxID=430521 RepID=A0ABV7BUN6_9PROT|nr:MarR family transcriptional regulator [Falsiroseomonas tokyonensis]MBU8539230.1 MarR family transcriptional regulator [Falsiroseomonas tokyonensis]
MPSKPAPNTTPSPCLKLEDNLCFALYAANHAFTAAYKPLLDPLGLTYPQYLVLLVLWEAEDQTVKALGQRLHLDSGTLTPLLKRMETAGLVRRRRDAEDERQVRIALTEAGRALQARTVEVQRRLSCLLQEASPAALRDALLALTRALRRGPPPA